MLLLLMLFINMMLNVVLRYYRKYSLRNSGIPVVTVNNGYDGVLARGNMPVQAKANNFHLNAIPPKLSSLNALEIRPLSLHVSLL